MADKNEPWCVLDGTTTPALMRCKHCHATEPVQFPVPVDTMKNLIDAFLQTHGLCHMSLKKMKARVDALWERTPSTLPARNRNRNEILRLNRAILLREQSNRKKRAEKA
jgi:hypothetical protein